MSDSRRGQEGGASSKVAAPTLQLLAWVAERPRTYADVMEAWRSSCPRLSVWEDATTDGLVGLEGGRRVVLTPRGRALLDGASASDRDEVPQVAAAE